jgi:hypothetical protein
LYSLSPEQYAAADVNFDGRVNVTDASLLLQSLSKGASLPSLPSPTYSARFSVDVEKRQVLIAPLASLSPSSEGEVQAQSIFGGSKVAFNSSTLLDQPGDVGRKVLNVSLTNRSGEPMGMTPDGAETGIRLVFSDFNNLSTYPDIRSKSTVTALAGTGGGGSADGPALSATFNGPSSVAVDNQGTVYVMDYLGNTIRKVSAGQVSTLAGSGTATSVNGAGTAASFKGPWGITCCPYSVTNSASSVGL